jgi:methionyl-tRNA formyltransferase
MTPPPAKIWASENNIPCEQPATLKLNLPDGSPNTIYNILNTTYDVFIVASYGKIIPQSILDLPKRGTLNVHPSLLPRYRGASPLESTILSGDTETGVSIMLLDAEMDHGPVLGTKKFNLTGEEYFANLRDQTAQIGGELLAKLMPQWLAGEIKAAPQDHTQATFTKKIEKEDGLIDFDLACAKLSIQQTTEIYRKIRAFTPWPGTYFFTAKESKKIRIVIKKAHLENSDLIIDRVVPEGRSEMNWSDFARNLR